MIYGKDALKSRINDHTSPAYGRCTGTAAQAITHIERSKNTSVKRCIFTFLDFQDEWICG